ncbi:Putative ubiquitin specific protease domain, papain-like cysteine peptidase superfamily [Septoria linicola]|uniref:ubiquitinyl hydrolase 1 n=1 Tax=Septoria linicola TaxID=215465 RepID=A0A9Q9AS39_9PEZI|nr:putative ubiquitin specific protease domain, papain-like cysteine peptidase superfamily [Septoria linicola]USW50991.1 Putative ubiquitin specific protease domain, papain-like cysteine peptidase superfamily [Septoria linicola]
MSDLKRFLSTRKRKDNRRSSHSPTKNRDRKASPSKPTSRPDHFGDLWSVYDDPKVKPDKDEERRIAGILERFRTHGIDTMTEGNARYALRSTQNKGDGEAAFRLLLLLQETYEGIVKPYVPSTQLIGAVNRKNVTCYLDALLFAMFARLDSFEAMLYNNFDDTRRRRLAGLLRLWVNMLRTGRLITTDLTRHMQESLAECGWEDAANVRQQDPSEAFTFITGQLELPLLTLKMDLYHTGKEEPQDDHKFVNERLLEIAIPEAPNPGEDITLEDCLEHYFNNRVEVMRHLENQRRNTLKSGSDPWAEPIKSEKDSGIHVEVAEIASSTTGTPLVQTPISETPLSMTQTKYPLERVRPGLGRKRGNSIFSQRRVELNGIDPEKEMLASSGEKERKMSTKTEVLMPAWQFFKLLPWYTDHMPTSDAQVAAHFARKRPVLGICLKRYAVQNDGQATKRDTRIDIPLEIAVPNFVSDEHMQEDGPLAGNFRLILQSVVCHRGASVHSGHYVTLCRGTASNAIPESTPASRRGSFTDSEDIEDPWMLFDDLAPTRVTYVDIHQALRKELPYLVFYQVQPIGDDGHFIHDLPSYAEATSRSGSDLFPTEEKPYVDAAHDSDNALEQIPSQALSDTARVNSDITDWAPISGRNSLDAHGVLDGPRGRASMQMDERRRSTTIDDGSFTGSISAGSIQTDPTGSIPSTPADEQAPAEKTGFLAVASKMTGSRRGSKITKEPTSKSRPSSTGPGAMHNSNGSRFSLNLNMSKLTQKMSKTDISAPAANENENDSAAPTAVDATKTVLTPPATANSEVHPTRASMTLPRHESGDTMDTVKPLEAKPTHHQHSNSDTLTKKEKQAIKALKRKKAAEDRDCVMM